MCPAASRPTARFRTNHAALSESRRYIGKPLPAAALTRKGFSAHWQTAIAATRRAQDGGSLKLAPNQIHLAPENQATTMDAKPEHIAATKLINGRINGRFARGRAALALSSRWRAPTGDPA